MYKSDKKIIGILGGIGSGKSSVADIFGDLGCAVINADTLAHQELAREKVKSELVELFGSEILADDSSLDKKSLAEKVFDDQSKLEKLNKIIHPRVLKRTETLIEKYKGQNEVKAIVLDMPLLLEVGWDKRCDYLVFIDADREIRLKRIRKSGKIDETSLKNRENFQILLDKKASMADYIIDNNSDFSALVRQVTEIFTKIIRNG